MAYPGAKMGAGGDAGPPQIAFGPNKPQTWHVPKGEQPMYKYQAGLPRLPVPSLDHSVSMYLNSVRTLCSPQEWETTKKYAVEFLTSDVSRNLQDRLKRRAASTTSSSWLVDWWNELSYFGYRDSVVVWVSYFYQFAPDKWSHMAQTTRAAGYILASLRYRQLVVSGQLDPEMAGARPQDMSMYKFLFNSSRVPHPGKDYYVTYDAEFYHHVIVMRNGRPFKVDTRGEDGKELSFDQLIAQLDEVCRIAGDRRGSVGVLTTENRDTWAAARQALETDNSAELTAIASAALVVCLDDSSPGTPDEKARAAWHGDGENRWCDKPMQFIVAANGEAGFLGEHGIMDGTPTNACADWVLSQLAKGNIKSAPQQTMSPVPPTEITFTIVPKIEKAIGAAKVAFKKLIDSQDLRALNWTQFGKNGIKKMRVSPDAFVQMAVQLTYKRLHGKYGATYEACSTRGFLHGRTETIRSCHVPGANFCAAMDSAAPASEKYRLLKAAATHQSWYAKKASRAMGCDRHLLGLKLLSSEAEMPDLFKDPVFSRSSSWVISTSALASEHFQAWGFGEVVPDGYGVGYMVNANNISFILTSLASHPVPASRFHGELQKALADMHEMCTAALASRL
ncbi:Carnitine O-acetyltransferase [Diplonema papillatum]|nr:Carnitine O-acetyltransferase [Diplonema papillatum]KAJ9463899.1 Carnitine O-acetyltransferase [Diplonema papillatum]